MINVRVGFLITFFTILCFSLAGQQKFTVGLGMGLPDLLNVSARYQIKQTQLGVTVGSIPSADEKVFSLAGDLHYHFAGQSEVSSRKPWYLRTGYSFLREEDDYYLSKSGYLTFRIGKEINFSKRVGLAIDGGIVGRVSKKSIDKKATSSFFGDDEIDILGGVFPGISISFFCKL